jgi:hypothetical protein
MERHQAGDVPSRICHVLHLSPSTVARVLREVGVLTVEHKTTVEARQLRAEQAPQVRRLAEKGISPTQICKELHLGYDTLRQIAREHEIDLPKGRVGAPTQKARLMPRIRELVGKGLSQSEISEAVVVPLPTISRWLRQEEIHLGRIDRHPDRSANFGATSEERSARGSRGGHASADKLVTVACKYCGEEFTQGRSGSGRTSRDRYCSREHAYAYRRENSGKMTVYTCEYCSTEFQWWTNQPRKFCSREHFLKANKQVPKYGFEGQILDSGYEAAFVGMCSVLGIPFEFFDRDECVEWQPGSLYGPDFRVLIAGKPVFVDTKGQDRGSHKWKAFREQRGRLAILHRDDLAILMKISSSTDWLNHIRDIAVVQQAEQE